jgi:hypothetical protein
MKCSFYYGGVSISSNGLERERERERERVRRRRIVAVAWCCLEPGRGGNDKGFTLVNRLMVRFSEEN